MKNPPKITLQPASFQTFFPFIILFFWPNMMTNSELNSQQIKDDFLPLKILSNIY